MTTRTLTVPAHTTAIIATSRDLDRFWRGPGGTGSSAAAVVTVETKDPDVVGLVRLTGPCGIPGTWFISPDKRQAYVTLANAEQARAMRETIQARIGKHTDVASVAEHTVASSGLKALLASIRAGDLPAEVNGALAIPAGTWEVATNGDCTEIVLRRT